MIPLPGGKAEVTTSLETFDFCESSLETYKNSYATVIPPCDCVASQVEPEKMRKMSITLFSAVPAGAIEVLTDVESSPQFKRADLGRFLEIIDVKATYRDVGTTSRKILSRRVCSPHPSQRQNDQDAFVDLEAALKIVVRSKKPRAVELVKWLTRKGVEKVVQEHQQAIEEKQ